MTVVLLIQKKGEKVVRKEYKDVDMLQAMNEGSLIKHADKETFVIIFGKESKVDKMLTELEELR